ncbi:MAG: hypothetical protein H0T76_06875 [Nannocystis sp.]|nr:hypothetical protein [Nannocystis sp.]MBA3546185.1 hypothetical protein [Nannocystis sp.]
MAEIPRAPSARRRCTAARGNAIATLEFKDGGGAWHSVARESDNYFIQDGGMGEGTLHLRVTDVEGNVLEDPAVPLLDSQETPGGGQFLACAP